MKKIILLVLVFSNLSMNDARAQVPETTKKFNRIITIVLENTDYKAAIKDPYLKSLSEQGSLFTHFRGNFHPSYANYLAMVGGKYFYTNLDVQKDIDAKTIADLLEAKGLTWKNYAEGYPGNCFLGDRQGDYVRKHVPFLSFKNIQQNPERCANVVPSEDFPVDVARGTVPHFALYTPNLENDGHDSDLPTASAWLKKFLEPLLADTAFMNETLIEVTFDESKSYLNNHIYTLFIGNMVKKNFRSNACISHYNVLRTIEDNFGVGTLGAQDKKVKPIQNIWN